MKVQRVHHNEHPDKREEIPTVTAVPAPMVERAFRLLDLLSASEEGLTLSDLARALNMSKGSIHGLLKTLESNGAIEQAEERRFILGPRVHDIAQTYVQRAGLRRFALPAMSRLAMRTGQTVCLGKAERKGVRIVECIVDQGEHPTLHISAKRGTLVHLLAAATGPVVLASWPAAERETFLHADPLPRFTEHSITDPRQFLARVEEADRTGISFDHEEYLVGVNAVAAPIHGPGDILVALLWIAGFASCFQEEALGRAASQLHAEAVAVSRSLGVK